MNKNPLGREGKKDIFPQKGTVVLLLANGIVIAGKGMIDACKLVGGDFRFTGTLVKDYSSKKKTK